MRLVAIDRDCVAAPNTSLKWPDQVRNKDEIRILATTTASAQDYSRKIMPIGSSSMEPTYLKTDQIAINLDVYTSAPPQRGEVVTYRSPDNGLFWTHRIVGLPGDRVSYGGDKRLTINGNLVELAPVAPLAPPAQPPQHLLFQETLSGKRHLIQIHPSKPSFVPSGVKPSVHRGNCTFAADGFSCLVPEGHYFLMGDNRDSSFDSRYLGFIASEAIAGRVEGTDRLLPR